MRKLPPLSSPEAWLLTPGFLEFHGIPASEAEDAVAILKILAAIGIDTPEKVRAFRDECDDLPGSKAWIRMHGGNADEAGKT